MSVATAAPAAAAFHQAPLVAPTALTDPKTESLKAMFPDIEVDVLEAMLAFHQGDVEAAVSAILDVNIAPGAAVSQNDLDESVARAMQAEMDQELAQSVANQMRVEDLEQRRQERQQEPAARAAVAVEKAAAATKSFLQRAVRPLSARGRGSSHATRLLDNPSAYTGELPFDFAPLTVPAYTPPAVMAQPASPPVDINDAPQTEAALTASTERSSPPSSDRYSARLGRARAANQLTQRSTTAGRLSVGEASPPTAPATVAVEVPVGELI